jgi:site-specific recombinase XerD
MRVYVRHFMTPPDRLTVEDIHRFQLHLAKRQVAWSTFNVYVCALRFFYGVTLGRAEVFPRIPFQKTGRRLPVVLSRAEAFAVVEAPSNLKHRAILMVLYGSGLRSGEVIHLQPGDIDSQRGLIRVHQGKGRKDRQAPLPKRVLESLRAYWRDQHPPRPWLFHGRNPAQPLSRRSVAHIVTTAARTAGISKTVSPHSLRHTFATHLHESGHSLLEIQAVLGHRSPRTTAIYTHLAADYLARLRSPVDYPPPTT